MAVVSTEITYTNGVRVSERRYNDDGTIGNYNGAGVLQSTTPANAASIAAAQVMQAANTAEINRATIRAALVQAISDNVATLATVNAGLSIATSLKSTTIANVADAQARVRQAGAVLEGLVNAQAASTQQLTKLARLLLEQLDGTN